MSGNYAFEMQIVQDKPSASRLNLAAGARAMSASRVLTPSRIVVALQVADERRVGGQAGHFQAVEVAWRRGRLTVA